MEIVNKWLEGYLQNYVSAQQRAWVKWLHLGEYCYNTTYHMPIRMAPFKAIYGYEPLFFINTILGDNCETKGEGLASGGTVNPRIPEGKLTTGTKSTKDVRRQTPNGEEFQSRGFGLSQALAISTILIERKGKRKIEATIL